ncbi:TPA: hypothetical protein QDB10_006228 [Burkholderia vietnamiensis]|nr:hypothetical protein [Burkholderia vietnamiensis]
MTRRIIKIEVPFTGDWQKDKATVSAFAETPTTAENFYQHATTVEGLFHRLTYGTPSAPQYPERSGLSLKVHGELFPIAHFSRLYFDASNEVTICWRDGNQNFDATVEDNRPASDRLSICHLEVTTLQDQDDAKLLEQLATQKTVSTWGDNRMSDHLRKIELLKKMLEKKGKINYPPNTALLVYTDEDRIQNYSFPVPPPIDKKTNFEKVLHEMKNLLSGFSGVFVYSRNEIYCSLPVGSE